MNFPSVSNFSIAKGTGGVNPPEMYIPLFWHSGGVSASAATSTTNAYVLKGNTVVGNTMAARLHTLNSNWSPSLQYAFEATLAIGSGGGATVNAELYDITAGSAVTSSLITSTSNVDTVFRSGKFTLTPGHVYGVVLWTTNSSYTAQLTDASLIVFPQ